MSKEKQIEQTAREFCHLSAECETCQICDERYHTDGELCYFKLMANEIIHHGYRKQEWISVDDRLPQIAGKYLIARKTVHGNLINIVWYDTNYNGGNDDMTGKSVWYMFDSDWGDYEIPGVTHWMPLPQPPKMKGGAE